MKTEGRNRHDRVPAEVGGLARARQGRFALPLLVLLAAGTPLAAHASSMQVPPKVQAAILKKMLAYDRVLATKPSPKVLVVGSEANPSAAAELIDAFKELGVTAVNVRPDELAARASDDTIVYQMTGVPLGSVKRACTEKGMLSVSGFPGLAESGDVSVAVGLREDGKPQIIVNLTRLKAEGHEFSSELLKLSKVLR